MPRWRMPASVYVDAENLEAAWTKFNSLCNVAYGGLELDPGDGMVVFLDKSFSDSVEAGYTGKGSDYCVDGCEED